jgi:hypothetical protein
MAVNPSSQFPQIAHAGGHMMMMVPQQQQQQQMRMQMAPPFVGGGPQNMMNVPSGGGAFMGGGSGQPMFAPNQRPPMMMQQQQAPFMQMPFRVVGGGPSLPLQTVMAMGGGQQQRMMARGPMIPQQQQLPPHIMQQLALRAQRFGGGSAQSPSARLASAGQISHGNAAASPLTTIVRVQNLPVDDEALEATLRAHFEAFGAIAELVIFAHTASSSAEIDAGGSGGEACVRFVSRADAERAMADGGANFGSPSSSSPSVSASPSASSSKQRPLLLAWASSMQSLRSVPSATDSAALDGGTGSVDGNGDGAAALASDDQDQGQSQGVSGHDDTAQAQAQAPTDPTTMSRAERAYAAALEAAAGDYASEADRVAAAEAAWLAHGGGGGGTDADGEGDGGGVSDEAAAAVGDDGEQVCGGNSSLIMSSPCALLFL